MAEASISSGMRWSGISVLGREVSRTLFTILLARLIGPEEFGIAALATVYVGILGLLLDQGFSSALIQREHIDPSLPGAIVSVNVAVGAVLTAITIAIAPAWAAFMETPALTSVLVVLSFSLVIRSVGVTPRAMLMRSMQFRVIGIADAAAAVVGGILGLAVAVAFKSYWAVVVQVVATDVVTLLILLLLRAGCRPNLRLGVLRDIGAFSWRAFTAGFLLNSVARNIDNVLIGRFQGATSLAFYGLGYRLLLMPIQLTTTGVSTVLFPVFSRLAQDLPALGAELLRATRTLAVLVLPMMALVAAAAPQLVAVIFGPQWEPVVSIVQVLAIVGAIQASCQSLTAPVLLGAGRARLNLRYAFVASVVATAGIVAGLPYGPLGVAIGYSAACALILPFEWLVRRHVLGLSVRKQAAAILPGLHIAVWMAASYTCIAALVPWPDLVVLISGVLAAALTGATVLRLAHRAQFDELAYMVKRVAGRSGLRDL